MHANYRKLNDISHNYGTTEFFRPTYHNVRENFVKPTPPVQTTHNPPMSQSSHHLELKWEPAEGPFSSPDVFGPAQWFSYHTGALGYPINPSPITIERMKNFILGIPIMIPCKNCQEHATAFIESRYSELDKICSTRDSLFKFFVDFHNQVNIRKNKPQMSYEEAYKLYLSTINFKKLSYS